MSDSYEETYLDDSNPLECIEHEQKKVRYLQKYKKEWELDHKFRDWLEPIQNDPYSAYCNVCCSSLTARKKDLMDHGETRKHKKNLVYKHNNPALYHKMMQNIREVDANVIMDKSIPWQPDAIKCLILQVEQQHDHFYDTNVKKSTLFALICTEMNEAGFPCVPSECQRKWESLRKSYERVLQYQVKGEFKSRFPYFNMIHRFLAKDIDPLGMREKMLCQKLGRPYNPNDPLILDGNLDGTEYRTTIVSSKRDPPNVSISNTETTTEITISSCDLLDENEDLEADRIVGIDADDLVHFEEIDTDNLLEEGTIIGDQRMLHFESPVKIAPNEIIVREWEEGAVDALLAVMGEIEFSSEMMLAKGKFHDSFWELVSENLLVRYCEVSALECRQKWRQLLAQYKRVFERHQRLGVRKSGVAAFRYYDCVGRILEKIHSVKTSDLPRQKRRLDDRISEDSALKRRHIKGSRVSAPNKNAYTPERTRAAFPSRVNTRSRSGILSRKRYGEQLNVANVAEHIKKEREEVADVDEEEPFMNDTDGVEDEEALFDNGASLEPKLKMKLMQTSLLRVTRRIEMLEREVAKKNEDRNRDAREASHGPQIVDLLVNMLAEMKKMNSKKDCDCKCSCRRDDSNEKPDGHSADEQNLPSIINIVSECASLPADSPSAASERVRSVRKTQSVATPSSRVSSTKYQKPVNESEGDSLRKLVKSL
ncbi:hypothetical protein FHG87_013849 [Trinorchestia longiramus]|nr:hypothetical protein FHG87_013849 [Trinorchestia longiramus]